MSETPFYRADKHRVRKITGDRVETVAFCENSTVALIIVTALNGEETETIQPEKDPK